MTTYAELQAQIAELERKAQQARRDEIDTAKTTIRELMAAYGITIEDLRNEAPNRQKQPTAVAPKYRDPVSGATWTGRGRAPLWLNGRSKDDFLIS